MRTTTTFDNGTIRLELNSDTEDERSVLDTLKNKRVTKVTTSKTGGVVFELVNGGVTTTSNVTNQNFGLDTAVAKAGG